MRYKKSDYKDKSPFDGFDDSPNATSDVSTNLVSVKLELIPDIGEFWFAIVILWTCGVVHFILNSITFRGFRLTIIYERLRVLTDESDEFDISMVEF